MFRWLSMQRCGLFGLFAPTPAPRAFPVPGRLTPVKLVFPWLCYLGIPRSPPGKMRGNSNLKTHKKTLDKQQLCFYDFLRDVFAARFSGERRTGVRCLLGISRSQISRCKSSGSGTRAAGPPITRFFPNDWFFQKVVVVACESL